MYEVRETINGVDRVVLTTTDIAEVVRHIEAEGFEFFADVLGAKVFAHPDGRTAMARVRP